MLAGVVILVVAVSGLGLWFNRGPAPQWRPTTATITAIVPSEHRFHPNDHIVVVRNVHGTGQFTIRYPLRCNVGDKVAVEQAGVSLRAARTTCR